MALGFAEVGIIGPPDRVLTDVLSDPIQILVITHNVFIVVPLPDLYACG